MEDDVLLTFLDRLPRSDLEKIIFLHLNVYIMPPELNYKNVMLNPFILIRDALAEFNDREMIKWMQGRYLLFHETKAILEQDREAIIWKLLPERDLYEVTKVFCACVLFGNLPLIKWITQNYKLYSRGIWSHYFTNFTMIIQRNQLDALLAIIHNNHLDTLIWLDEHYGLSRDRVLKRSSHYIELAIKNNRLSILKWLTKRFKLTAHEVMYGGTISLSNGIIYGDSCYLWLAACDGCLDIIKWVITTFEPSLTEVMFRNNIILLAASHDHFYIVRWLVEHYKLPLIYLVNRERDTAWNYAFKYGRLRFLKWIDERFNFKEDIVAIDKLKNLMTAIRNSHMETTKWLVRRFGLMKEDLIGSVDLLFSNLILSRNPNLVNWVADHFDLGRSDICNIPQICFNLRKNYQDSPQFIIWMRRRFILDTDWPFT